MRRIMLVLPVSMALAGCAGSPVGDAIAGPEKLAQQDDSYCQSIGAQPGSPAYMNCRMQMTQMRENKHNVVRGAMLSQPDTVVVVPRRY